MLKKIAKYILQPAFRTKVAREKKISSAQDKAIELLDSGSKKLIVFFLDGAEYFSGKEEISGGLLSIHSIFQESQGMRDIHDAEMILCTVHGANLYHNFSSFKTTEKMYRYEQLANYFTAVTEVVVHIPEYLVNLVVDQFANGTLNWLLSKNLHLNILNQNITYMPTPEKVQELGKFANLLTQTAAHKRYANSYYREFYGIPLHHLSTFVSPEKYNFQSFSYKEKLITLSPDSPELNEKLITLLKRELPDYQVVVIQGLTYDEFKALVEKARFMFTFGEGLDGYFVEAVFTGGICFAIYNEEFFTEDFGELPTVHISFDELISWTVEQVRSMETEAVFNAANKEQFTTITRHYGSDRYVANIRAFYHGQYHFK